MTDRTKGRTLEYRANVPWRVYDLINRRDCLHIDAWLYQAGDDTLYFNVQSRAGGRMLVRSTWLRVDNTALTPVSALDPSTLVQRHINSPWGLRNAPQLRGIHARVLQPAYMAPAEGFKGYRSIALHYVYSDARVSDPLAGIENLYGITGRGQSYPDENAVPAATRRRSPLDRDTRSRLRTLDKILGTNIA